MGSVKSKEEIVINQASNGDARSQATEWKNQGRVTLTEVLLVFRVLATTNSICGNKIFKEKLEDDRKKRNIQKLTKKIQGQT